MDSHERWLKTEMADVWLGFDRARIRAWFEQAGLVNVIVDCTGESCRQSAKTEGGGLRQHLRRCRDRGTHARIGRSYQAWRYPVKRLHDRVAAPGVIKSRYQYGRMEHQLLVTELKEVPSEQPKFRSAAAIPSPWQNYSLVRRCSTSARAAASMFSWLQNGSARPALSTAST
jgi:hypothetical protein